MRIASTIESEPTRAASAEVCARLGPARECLPGPTGALVARQAMRRLCCGVVTLLLLALPSGCSSVSQAPGYVTMVEGKLILRSVCDLKVTAVSVSEGSSGTSVQPDIWAANDASGGSAARVTLFSSNPGYIETARIEADSIPDWIGVDFEVAERVEYFAGFMFRRAGLRPGLAATPRGVVDEARISGHPEFLNMGCPARLP